MTYPAVVLLGFGFSIMMVNSLNFAAELIGDNKVSQITSKIGTAKINTEVWQVLLLGKGITFENS